MKEVSEWIELDPDEITIGEILKWGIGENVEIEYVDPITNEWHLTNYIKVGDLIENFQRNAENVGNIYRYRPIPQPKTPEELAMEWSRNNFCTPHEQLIALEAYLAGYHDGVKENRT